MSAPGLTGGDSPLTSYEATVDAGREAVRQAQAATAAQQQAAGRWLDGGMPAGKVVDPGPFRH